jgi:2-polyprenyl-6-methoxyphenol hydroxylase-like FAD-dependent oxidoreductase
VAATATGLIMLSAGSSVPRFGGDAGCQHTKDGRIELRAGLTVGADGIRSTVARAAGAATQRVGTGAGAVIYGYWSELPVRATSGSTGTATPPA